MVLKVNLKNVKYCEGCPCLGNLRWNDEDDYCLYGYGKLSYVPGNATHTIRPAECIKDNGE